MKTVTDMARREFEKLPHAKWGDEVICNSIIFLPSEISAINLLRFKVQRWLSSKIKFIHEPDIYQVDGMHDSGFRCMDFVAVDAEMKPMCRLSGCSDVVHIDGIGGFGENWLSKYGTVPQRVPPSGWSIDCLPKSGLLRMFPAAQKIKCGFPLSSFEIFAVREDKTRVN